MKQLNAILTGLILLVSGLAFGQPYPEQCATMQVDSALRAQNPSMGTLEEFENWLSKEMVKREDDLATGRANRVVYTIPIVFHIIHNGDPVGVNENISAAQVMSQITVLNEDFRRLAGTPGFNNNPVGADVEIEFCPAVINPQGQVMAEPGINRVQRTEANWPSTTTIDNTLKPATIWDPNLYANVWVVDFGSGGLLGYSQFPSNSGLAGLNTNGGAANTDGNVIRYTTVGRPPANPFSGTYNRGRTLTHEMGHWFGLRHIWGDGGCSVDDYCNDTPTSDSPNYNCPTGTVKCGSTDMIENYMDYTGDVCMNIFTICQKSRMQTVMSVSPRRASLANSTVCQLPSTPPVAQFTANITTVCSGSQVTFTDQSTNNPTSWSWSFPGGTPATSTAQNPTVTYNTPGTYNVTLTATNQYGNNTATATGYITVISIAAEFTASSTNICVGQTIQFTDLSSCNPTSRSWSFPGGTPASSSSQNPSVTYNSPGVYNVTLSVTNANGNNSLTKTGYITVVSTGVSLPFVETFENGFGAQGWSIENPDGGITWQIASVAGNSPGSNAAYVNLYSYTSVGQRDGMISPPINLSGYSTVTMSFEHAHRRYSSNQRDSLIVYVSTNCGLTYQRIFAGGENGQGSFATGSILGSNFVPSAASDWCFSGGVGASCFTLDLTPFAGNSNVRVKFETYNDYGNNLFIDNINITGTSVNQPPVADFAVNFNTTCSGTVVFTDQSANAPTSWQWNFGDGTTSTAQNPIKTYSQSGTFTITLVATNAFGSDTEVKTGFITVVLPTAPVAQNDTQCGAGFFNLSAAAPGTVYWFDAQQGGNQLATGPAFVTPFLNATTTYYVENRQTLVDTGFVGPADNTFGAGAYFTGDRFNYFDAFKPFLLKSVKVYANGAGNRTIQLRNSSGQVLQSLTVNIPNGESRVTLNFNVPIGTDHQIGWAAGSNPNLWRSNSNLAYPYTIPGVVSITRSDAGSNPTGFYYAYYDWEVVYDGEECISARVPVTAVVATSGNFITQITGANESCQGCNNGAANVATNGANPPFSYLWSNGATSATITGLAPGIYSVTVTNGFGCIDTGSVIIQAFGCQFPVNIAPNVITQNDVTIRWNAIPGVPGYELRIRPLGTNNWLTQVTLRNNVSVACQLNPNTIYEYQVRTYCSPTITSAWSPIQTFQTLQQTVYCNSGSTQNASLYIRSICVSGTCHQSGNTGLGYEDFSCVRGKIRPNVTYNLELTAQATQSFAQAFWYMWIDLNRDGDFDPASELVYFSGPVTSALTTGTFSIPASTCNGPTRMRLALSTTMIPNACSSFNVGQTEDYTLVIEFGQNCSAGKQENVLTEAMEPPFGFKLYPNPANEVIHLEAESLLAGSSSVTIMSAHGKKVLERQMVSSSESLKIQFPVADLAPGVYFVRLENNGHSSVQRFVKH